MDVTKEYPELSKFFKSCFPQNDPKIPGDPSEHTEQTEAIAYTRPRPGVTYFRHPTTQAGIVMKEDGSIEIRCGRATDPESPGSAVVLNPNGTITMLAPNGLMFSGRTIYLPKRATDSFTFAYGSEVIDPFWETQAIGYINPSIPPDIAVLCIVPGSPVPIPLPLRNLILEETLYTDASILSADPTG